jgi:hypothetical protein
MDTHASGVTDVTTMPAIYGKRAHCLTVIWKIQHMSTYAYLVYRSALDLTVPSR